MEGTSFIASRHLVDGWTQVSLSGPVVAECTDRTPLMQPNGHLNCFLQKGEVARILSLFRNECKLTNHTEKLRRLSA